MIAFSIKADGQPVVTSKRANYWLQTIDALGRDGITVKDVRDSPDPALHHGSASGMLSDLHKVGALARLKKKGGINGRFAVYVTPNHVGDRETVPFQPRVSKKEWLRLVKEARQDGWEEGYLAGYVDADNGHDCKVA